MRWKNRLIRFLPWSLGRDALRSFVAHEGIMIAGYLAYMGLLSFFPFIIFLVALAAFFGDTALGIAFLRFLYERMPPEVVDILRPALAGVLRENRPGLMTFSIAFAVWTSMSGLEAVRASLNRAFHVHTRLPYWQRLLHSFASTILAALSILIAMFLLVASPAILHFAEPYFVVPEGVQYITAYLRWLVPPALLFGASVVLYWSLCAAQLSWQLIWPGALLTVFLWMAAGWGLSLYLAHFNRFPTTYGSLGSAVILLIFFYVMALIFLVGAELNAAIMRHTGERAETERQPGV
jgi:membrane protein